MGKSPGPDAVLIMGWLLNAIATVAIIARSYLRLGIQRRRLMFSDYLILAAWGCAVATNGMLSGMACLGGLADGVMMTLRGYRGSTSDMDMVIKLFIMSHVPLWSTFYLCKAALLAAYTPMFLEFMKKRKIFLWVTVIYNVLAYFISLIVLLLVCEPETDWSLSIPGQSCAFNYGEKIFIATWTLHFFGDLLVFMLPWLFIPSMNLNSSIRIGVYCTFLLGGITIVTCIVRIVTLEVSQVGNNVAISLMVLWNILECNISLIVACLPSLRPYFRSRDSTIQAYGHTRVKSEI